MGVNVANTYVMPHYQPTGLVEVVLRSHCDGIGLDETSPAIPVAQWASVRQSTSTQAAFDTAMAGTVAASWYWSLPVSATIPGVGTVYPRDQLRQRVADAVRGV
jgi:hypothetical protein